MIAWMTDIDRHRDASGADDCDRFERFTYRRSGEFPVRSHAARTRGKMRSRGHGGRRKASPFNGVNRRGRRKLWTI
jgi:hypothetical protein